ncbi:hypothetical protein A8924_5004 [Saccharopolyspora erythraea NRRL 2338]|uniref:Methylamine utilization protein MauD n=1 Tax=Saccharopolyspora erythraea TaxID=1836 RepID=A0ABN1CRV4_SACER|nr:methylamine utilization protein [Saccharopolyspora erythraea]EQD87891.1 methylamine utilization protein [Saccharopolyspora erythraea D]PFG97562.1 hypothetical protein A8924_5004 [Saccharopolyspora erythraea NRRL 2338]QRK87732.1 methylamine utilization protein [Saccharopolyspora erythraea]
MTAEWAVLLLLSLLAVLNSVAAIALIRQRIFAEQPASAAYGPTPGTSLDVGVPVESLSAGADKVLFGFISPQCGHCRIMLAEFVRFSARIRVVLVSAADPQEARAHLAAHDVDLPLVTGTDVFDANDVPGPPYAVVTDGRGIVLAQGGANRPEHLEELLSRADALRPPAT